MVCRVSDACYGRSNIRSPSSFHGLSGLGRNELEMRRMRLNMVRVQECNDSLGVGAVSNPQRAEFALVWAPCLELRSADSVYLLGT